MYSKTVDLWYAMRDTRLDGEERATFEEEAVHHWVEQLAESLELISDNLSSVKVSIADAPEPILEVLAYQSPLISLKLYSTVHVQALVTIDEKKPAHPKSEGPPSEDFCLSFFPFIYPSRLKLHVLRPTSLVQAATFLIKHTHLLKVLQLTKPMAPVDCKSQTVLKTFVMFGHHCTK